MSWFLDSNVCIDCLRGRSPYIKQMLQSLMPAHIKIPSMVKAELIHGAQKSAHPKRNQELVELFLAPFEIVAFDDVSANMYGQIRCSLEKKGQIIGFNDLIIAATVMAHEGTLVTANTKEFSRIKSLKLEDWSEEPF
ncbi:MAG: type II toxin-antitoxin system VapC family toxin [Eggerthellaceae bacterium]|nr:type II toxin-antitoxin system VapC family toxin [Eggerthellaceae bacterium]